MTGSAGAHGVGPTHGTAGARGVGAAHGSAAAPDSSPAPDAGAASGPESGHLGAHLRRLAERVETASVDRLWIFPTRRVAGAFSTVIVLAAFDDQDDRRRVLTAHFTVRVDKRGRLDTHMVLAEHGAAPADRVGRVVDGVLRRLDEDLLATPPHAARIAGDAARWAELADALSTAPPPGADPLAQPDLIGE